MEKFSPKNGTRQSLKRARISSKVSTFTQNVSEVYHMVPFLVAGGLVIAVIGLAIPDEQKFKDKVKAAVKGALKDAPPAKEPTKEVTPKVPD
jgi:hypothetical protein